METNDKFKKVFNIKNEYIMKNQCRYNEKRYI